MAGGRGALKWRQGWAFVGVIVVFVVLGIRVVHFGCRFSASCNESY